MDFLAVAFRNAIPQEHKYLPYSFERDWTDDEKSAIHAAIDSHVPNLVAPTFNNWLFSKWGPGHYYARRATWDMGGLHATTAQGLADQVAVYYAEYCAR